MKSIYVSSLILCTILYGRAEDASEGKKVTEQRDVNDAAETVDYALSKIPVYLISNMPPVQEDKVPVAVISGAYPPAYLNAGIGVKETKQHKYGFYAPYKIPKVTPIHEPSSEETPLAYGPQYVYQKPEYDPAYKIPAVGKNYPATGAFVKYDNTAKGSLAKYQSLANSNAYASIAPSSSSYASSSYAPYSYAPSSYAPSAYAPQPYAYPNPEQPSSNYAPVPAPSTKKYTTYDPENQVQIQYVIKYVPVPYTVQSAPSADQQPQTATEIAYITPKSYYKETYKKPFPSSSGHNAPTASPEPYPSSTETYADYAKYAESYGASSNDEYTNHQQHQQQQYQSPLFKSYVQPSPYKYTYHDKNAKKYVPTSYVLATIGKSAPTHYASTVKHENVGHENAYTTKLVSVPLPVDKYTAQDYKSPPADDASKSYFEADYSYSVPAKYKPSAISAVSHLLAYDYNTHPHQYQPSYYKKDVSTSVSSTSSSSGKSSEKL